MSELYWINVLGSLSYISSLFCVIFGIATIMCFVWSIAVVVEEDVDDKIRQLPKKYLKYIAILFSISLTINIFVPRKNDLYAIYGIGTANEYCKNNSGVKELPDNAIKALNAYLKHIEKYNTNNSNENTEVGSSNN